MRLSCAALVFALLCSAARAGDIHIYATISLTDELRAVQPKFESITTDRLVFTFAGSAALSRKLMKGAPGDVFLSADAAKMKLLGDAGLIDPATRHDVFFNRLAVVVPKDSPLRLTALADLAQPGIKHLALPDPGSVPAGGVAEGELKQAGIWDQVRRRLLPTLTARSALTKVEDAHAEAGIVFLTDAQVSTKVKIAVTLTDSAPGKLAYPIAVLTHAPNPTGARKFVYYLENNPDARAVFAKYGFVPGAPVVVK